MRSEFPGLSRLNQPLAFAEPVVKKGGDTSIAIEAIVIQDVCDTSHGSERIDNQNATPTLQDDQDTSHYPNRPWIIFYSILCVPLGIVEVALGFFVFSVFSNPKGHAGAWWSGVIVSLSGDFTVGHLEEFREYFFIIIYGGDNIYTPLFQLKFEILPVRRCSWISRDN